jgi:hypothetical protein
LKKYAIATLFLFLFLAAVPFVMANGPDLLRIDPYWPTAVNSPAEFEVWCNQGVSYDVKIHLVVTEDCYASMAATDAVVVEYEGSPIAEFDKGDFAGVTLNSDRSPPGVGYTVASLKDHIDEGLSVPLGSSDTIYWAWKPLADAAFDPLGETHEEITVTVNAGEIRMLVHLFGNSEDNSGEFDMRVPTTPSGFVIPEVATILLAGASFAGFGLYAIKRKRK